jgi:hypothetical protein
VNIDWPNFLLGTGCGAVLGGMFGAFYSAWLSSPKIQFRGMNGAGDGVVERYGFTIRNKPGFYGIVIGRVMIDGKQLTRGFAKGRPFERQTAKLQGFVMGEQKELGPVVYGYDLSDPALVRMKPELTLKSGDETSFTLLCSSREHPGKFFFYVPTSETDEAPIIPPVTEMLEADRKFKVIFQTSPGPRRVLTLDVSISMHLVGRPVVEIK